MRSSDPILADTIMANYRAAHQLSPRRRAMLDLAVKMTRSPDVIAEDDINGLRDHGFTDEDIFDIIQIAAFFNYSNRVATAVEMLPNHEFHSMAREPRRPRE